MTGYSHVLSDFFRVVCLTLYCLKNIVFICLSKLRTALVFSMRAVFFCPIAWLVKPLYIGKRVVGRIR